LTLLYVLLTVLFNVLLLSLALLGAWRLNKISGQGSASPVNPDRYLNEITILSDVARAISGDFDLENLLDKILAFATQVISQAQSGEILLLDETRRDRLIVKGTYGYNKDMKGNEHFLGEGYTGWVAQEKMPIIAADVPADYSRGRHVSRFTPIKMEMKIKSSIAVPVMIREQVYGVIILHSTQETHAFDHEDLRLLSVISDQVAVAIENNRLYRETESALSEHQALYSIGLMLTKEEDMARIMSTIVDSAVKITMTKAGSLALYDRESKEFYLAASVGFTPAFSSLPRWKRREGGLTSRILASVDPVVINDISTTLDGVSTLIMKENIKSLVAVPLRLDNRVVGILYVDDFTPREFTSREISALSLLANQAAIALLKAQAMQQTMEFAITDGLTKLFNHRYFQERLDQELRRSRRYKHPISLIMADIDFFKNYNDQFGHPRGDTALKTVAGILRAMTRETDIIARYGGEEFVLVLPETTKTEATMLAKRIVEAIEAESFFGEEAMPGGKFTISMGVAAMPDDASNKQDLIDAADKSLYKAKDGGRNQVVTAAIPKVHAKPKP
jgi:diguanylate cyclase (GGDEF)-like protein